MDGRWQQSNRNAKRTTIVRLHPTASIHDVKTGVATDAVDVSKLVSRGTQSPTETRITLDWNNELLGANQPQPGWVVELFEDGQILWLGVIWSLSSYNLALGQRQTEILARSREQFDTWKLAKLVTQLYPQNTNYTQIITDICQQVGLFMDEISVPPSAFLTAHMNTQLQGMPAWDMLNNIMLAMGLTPWVSALGVVKGIPRDTNGRSVDIQVTQDRIITVQASRSKAPTTRVILTWTDPNLSKVTKLPQKLADLSVTMGWFLPYYQKHVWFSSDNTQRAENTYVLTIQSPNMIPGLHVVNDPPGWEQTSDTEGLLYLYSLGWDQAIIAASMFILTSSYIPDLVQVGPTGTGITKSMGRAIEGAANSALFFAMSIIGTGQYEIWGTPYDIIHAKNVSEAYNADAPGWLDNPQNIDNNFITNEAHAQTVVVRELLYTTFGANEWGVVIVEDRRIEKGDLLGFPDGSVMYVNDFSREIGNGVENKLTVKGFLVTGVQSVTTYNENGVDTGANQYGAGQNP